MNDLFVNLIMAVDNNWNIGRNNKLLFRSSKDMRFFKNKTVGNFVIMGSKTFKSIGKPLENRFNLVLSKHEKENIDYFDHSVFNSIEDVHLHIKNMFQYDYILSDVYIDYPYAFPDPDVYVIGGASIYDQYLTKYSNMVRTIYVTKIDKVFDDADASVPNLNNLHFIREYFDKKVIKKFSENGDNFEIYAYKRKYYVTSGK